MTTWVSDFGDKIILSAIPASASSVWRPGSLFLEWAGESASLCRPQGHSRRTLGSTGFIVCAACGVRGRGWVSSSLVFEAGSLTV